MGLPQRGGQDHTATPVRRGPQLPRQSLPGPRRRPLGLHSSRRNLWNRAAIRTARSFQDGRARVRIDNRGGFIEPNGPLAVPPLFEGANGYAEGLAPVQQAGEWGYIDKAGKVVIPMRFTTAASFAEGLAAVKTGKTWGFIDKNGELVIPATYEATGEFAEGLCPYKSAANGASSIPRPSSPSLRSTPLPTTSPKVWLQLPSKAVPVISTTNNTSCGKPKSSAALDA